MDTKILDKLANKEIYLSCGYGGVLFVEIGNIQAKDTAPKRGDYRLFCDETWTFSDGKDVNIDRWASSSRETDDLFESLGVRKLERVEVVNNFEKTLFHLSGGYVLAIIRDDSIETFSIEFLPEKKKLTVFGNGKTELKDYEEDLSYLKEIDPYPPKTKTVAVDRSFLRDQAPDQLSTSYTKAREFVEPILNKKIQAIKIDSGTRFTLCLGADYRKILSKKDQKSWHKSLHRWSLSIDELWILKKENKVVLDVRQERFHFRKKLTSFIENEQILEIKFDEKGFKMQLRFSNNYSLELLEANRYSQWYLHDFLTGLSVGSDLDPGLVYRIGSPIHLLNEFQTGDIHLDAILYELKFYRDYFKQGLIVSLD